MINRLKVATIALLKAIDILACTIWLAPLYVVNLADKPSGRQMISSYVGKAMVNGHRWARVVGAVIDWVFQHLFGDRPDHCVRAYLHYRSKDQ